MDLGKGTGKIGLECCEIAGGGRFRATDQHIVPAGNSACRQDHPRNLAQAALGAIARGDSQLTNGPVSTLPAFVAAAGRDDPSVRTLVLTPQSDGGVQARIIWGASETLGGQSTARSTAHEATPEDEQIAELAANLVAPSGADVKPMLAQSDVAFVLLGGSVDGVSDEARALRLSAEASLDQLSGLIAVGDTSRGVLWRVSDAAVAQPSAQPRAAGVIVGMQLVIVLIALLLAVPTAASRRAARRWPQLLVGSGSQGETR